MATAAELAVIRQWCGSDVGADGDEFDAIDVDERLIRLGSAHAAALEILRQRRTDLVMSGKQSVDGDFDHDPAESVKQLASLIGQLEAIVDRENGTGSATTSQMVRRTSR